MHDLSLFLLIQTVFDLLLILLVLLLYFQVRRLKRLPLDEVIKRLETAHELCDRLSANLAEKKELSAKLMSALKTGAVAWENSRKDASSLKEKVLALAEEGKDLAEIARVTGLQEGEVALILSVSGRKKAHV